MRVHVAAAGNGPRSLQSVQRFQALADQDVVGLHPLVEDPEEADLVLVVDLHGANENEVFPGAWRRSKLPRSWHGKIRVYDQRDNGHYTYPGLYVAPAPRLVKSRRQKPAPYISTIAPVAKTDTEPDLLYSFIGTSTYPARQEIFRLRHPRAVVEETRGINFFTYRGDGDTAVRRDEQAAHLEVAQQRYVDVLGRSKFVLCPRGLGPSSFRLYETLRVGRVPVIISDQWIPPEEVPWHACSIRISEGSVRDLPRILESNEDRWPELAAGVRATVETFLAPSVLWNYLIKCLADISPGLELRPWWADRRIIRHHVAADNQSSHGFVAAPPVVNPEGAH